LIAIDPSPLLRSFTSERLLWPEAIKGPLNNESLPRPIWLEGGVRARTARRIRRTLVEIVGGYGSSPRFVWLWSKSTRRVL
jgi:hypothetical protein